MVVEYEDDDVGFGGLDLVVVLVIFGEYWCLIGVGGFVEVYCGVYCGDVVGGDVGGDVGYVSVFFGLIDCFWVSGFL